jgi:hypothetical protein
VVVRVLADIVQVVVLAAGADALLRVHGALELAEFRARIRLAQEDRLELVHPRVGEQQRRVIVGHARRAGHERVRVRLGEEVDERLSDLVGGQGHGWVGSEGWQYSGAGPHHRASTPLTPSTDNVA